MKTYIFLVAFALISCDRKSQAPSAQAPSGSEALVIDQGLRELYSVRSISGSFKAPKGSSHYIVTTLEFEDGMFTRRGPMTIMRTESLNGRSSTAQFLWGEQSGKNRTALVSSGSVSRVENDFFWKPMMSTNNFGDISGPYYEGYKVLGMGQSDITRAGIGNMSVGADVERALKERMFVGLLVVRFFSSEKEMEEFIAAPHFRHIQSSKE
jgi:hypothetical protein